METGGQGGQVCRRSVPPVPGDARIINPEFRKSRGTAISPMFSLAMPPGMCPNGHLVSESDHPIVGYAALATMLHWLGSTEHNKHYRTLAPGCPVSVHPGARMLSNTQGGGSHYSTPTAGGPAAGRLVARIFCATWKTWAPCRLAPCVSLNFFIACPQECRTLGEGVVFPGKLKNWGLCPCNEFTPFFFITAWVS